MIKRRFIYHLDRSVERELAFSNLNGAKRVVGGSAVAGQQNGRAKLVEAQVYKIRQMYAFGRRITDLAAEFNVSEGAIRMIVNRKTWKHI